MTGETQLRARRTRIKILRAIADRKGAAGFSDIKDSTGLSTGSIYYHLERMGDYIVKDSKQYTITEQGINLLREIEGRPRDYNNNSALPAESDVNGEAARATATSDAKDNDNSNNPVTEHERKEDTIKNTRQSGRLLPRFRTILAIASVASVAGLFLFINWSQPFFLFSSNAGWIWAGSGTIMLALFASFLFLPAIAIVSKRSFFGIDGRLMLSIASVASVLSVSVLFFSGGLAVTSGTTATHYDNTLDALLSSYSFQWGLG